MSQKSSKTHQDFLMKPGLKNQLKGLRFRKEIVHWVQIAETPRSQKSHKEIFPQSKATVAFRGCQTQVMQCQDF